MHATENTTKTIQYPATLKMEQYDTWDRTTGELDYLGLLTSASELHGTITALTLLSGGNSAETVWELLPLVAEWWDHERAEQIRNQLTASVDEFHSGALALLEPDGLLEANYPVLLPDNDDLHEAALEMGNWCGGFLKAFAFVDKRDGLGLADRQSVLEPIQEIRNVAELADGADLTGASDDDLLIVAEQVSICVASIAFEAQSPDTSEETAE